MENGGEVGPVLGSIIAVGNTLVSQLMLQLKGSLLFQQNMEYSKIFLSEFDCLHLSWYFVTANKHKLVFVYVFFCFFCCIL